jgi:hypothetical protein
MSWVKKANRRYKNYEESRKGFRIYCIRPRQRHQFIIERDGEKWLRTDFIRGRFLAINRKGLTFTRSNLVDLWQDIELYTTIGFICSSSNCYNMHPFSAEMHHPQSGEKDLPFEFALVAMREGNRVRRAIWPAGVFSVMMPELSLAPYSTADTSRKVNDRTAKWIGPDTPLNCHPYFAIYMPVTNIWQPGWIPNVYDLLGEDWEIMAPTSYSLE